MPGLELTLVVAATARDMGIGAAGGLPWTGLRKEMAYFARVTKRGEGNAVIMGRKTWDSIPPKFRPLKGRLNVVISRSFAPGLPSDAAGPDGPVEASSLESALQYLQQKQQKQQKQTEMETETESDTKSNRVFVIGGAQIYAAALGLPAARRVLLTRVQSDFACDTFFPVNLGEAPEWVQKSRAEHAAWVGEELAAEPQVENGVEYEFQMWEKL